MAGILVIGRADSRLVLCRTHGSRADARRAVITGASSGSDCACAEHLARAGVAVVLGARRADRLDEAVAQHPRRGWSCRGGHHGRDLRDGCGPRSSRTRETAFGGLDIMVCNAGFGYYGTVEETPPDVMRRMMDVNFMGTFYGARAALPIFRAAGQRAPDRSCRRSSASAASRR